MSEKVKVSATFTSRVTVRAEVEMTKREYEKYCEKLDHSRGRELRRLHEDMFDAFNLDRNDGEFDDFELDDFYLEETP